MGVFLFGGVTRLPPERVRVETGKFGLYDVLKRCTFITFITLFGDDDGVRGFLFFADIFLLLGTGIFKI